MCPAAILRARWLVALAGLVGCNDRPDARMLAAWREEAKALDVRRTAEAKAHDPGVQWSFHMDGQITRPEDLSLLELRQLPAVDITVPAKDVYAERRFRGVEIRTLLDRAGPSAEPKTATFVAKDGYFATLDLADLRAHPFILAFDQDGKASLPALGGPLSVRFDPRSVGAELQRRYQYSDVFYVTHMIIGDEPTRLAVGSRTLDDAALDRLSEVSRTEPVAYRTGWEATPQTLWGVRLVDAMRAAASPEGSASVRVLGKDASHRENEGVPTFSAADLERCEPMLVRRHGPQRTQIPTRMGGPLLLHVAPACREKLGRGAWLSFVERLEALPP